MTYHGHILKEAGIFGIIILLLLSSTTISAITAERRAGVKEDNSLVLNPDNYQSLLTPSLFYQAPYEMGSVDWFIYDSDVGRSVLCTDDFWGLSKPISRISWWGAAGIGQEPTNMKFMIAFLTDDLGEPGKTVAIYPSVSPRIIPTYRWYAFQNFLLYYFQYDLNPAVSLDKGWIIIQCVYNPNSEGDFSWINSPMGNNNAIKSPGLIPLYDNLAFALFEDTKDPLPSPVCTGDLTWVEVPAGATVEGKITIANMGEKGSYLDWEIVEWPTWGTWSFEIAQGYHLLRFEEASVNVTCVVSDQKNKEFTGEIKIVNRNDPSSYCMVPVYLSTPLVKSVDSSFLDRFISLFSFLCLNVVFF